MAPQVKTSSVNPRQFMNRKKKTMGLTMSNCIIAAFAPLRRIIHIIAVALIFIFFIFPPIAFTQCAGISEEGRWRNLDAKGEPSYIDIKMSGGCGDEVRNGGQTGTSIRYTMRVLVREVNGNFSGRWAVKAIYQPWEVQ